MSLYPFNRHVSIIPDYIEKSEKESESEILLPSGYSKQESRYCGATVLDWASDCRLELSDGCYVLVDRNMIEEIEYEGESYYLILDNYIIAEISDDEGEE